MDVAAAIRAQTNQLEAQKKKKQQQQQQLQSQTTEFNRISNNQNSGHALQKSRSFHDERNQFNPYAAQLTQHNLNNQRHYINSEYQFENKTVDCEDNDSITSSLSGTLPGTIEKLDAQHLKVTSTSSNVNKPLSQSSARSVGSTGTRERITPGGNIMVMDTDGDDRNGDLHNEYHKNNSGGSASKVTATSTTTSSNHQNNNPSNNSSTKSNRIEEIMSAYQGKVDTILKKRGEEHSFKTLIEKNHHSITNANTSNSITTNNVSSNNNNNINSNNLRSSQASMSSSSPGIENILDTYKKKVGEIMNNNNDATTTTSSKNNQQQPSYQLRNDSCLAVDFDKIADDDEESFDREGVFHSGQRRGVQQHHRFHPRSAGDFSLPGYPRLQGRQHWLAHPQLSPGLFVHLE